jgi:uncharacterized coiled-coil DUF342 family protein
MTDTPTPPTDSPTPVTEDTLKKIQTDLDARAAAVNERIDAARAERDKVNRDVREQREAIQRNGTVRRNALNAEIGELLAELETIDRVRRGFTRHTRKPAAKQAAAK